MSILIIGAGKVGMATAISLGNNVDFHDPPQKMVVDDFNKYDYAIVCVDTTKDGPEDYRILESVLHEMNDIRYSGLVAIRSTVSPAKIGSWDKLYNLNYIMFPEFMPQRDGKLVTDTAWIAVLGGREENTRDFADNVLIKHGYPADLNSYFYVSKEEAAIIKLADNAALSTKLTYFNMIYKICEDFGASYDVVRNAVGSDSRIGIAHSVVPSPDDGMFGFGGHCLPKDLLVIADLDKFGFFDKINEVNRKLR
jgi:UDP-glucose 6-dehydrogenase